jgi:hypothetical protein
MDMAVAIRTLAAPACRLIGILAGKADSMVDVAYGGDCSKHPRLDIVVRGLRTLFEAEQDWVDCA